MYMAEFRTQPDAEARNHEITNTVIEIGFERPSDDEYTYRGPDPATALDRFSEVRPLILDCGTALHLATFIAIKCAIGPSQFNSCIAEMHDGVLSIDKQQTPAVPTNHTAFYSARHEQQENVLPADLRNGDRLWVQGPAHGYAFHPASEVNGFNVVVDKSDPDQTTLVGFVSDSRNGCGRWSYDELRQFLLDAYNKPLTLRDLKNLRAKAKYNLKNAGQGPGQDVNEPYASRHASYSSWKFTSALQRLAQDQPDAIQEAYQRLNQNDVDLDQLTSLQPPEADTIRGVMQHGRMKDPISLYALTHYTSDYQTVAPNPDIPESRVFGLGAEFETSLPHQRQVAAAMGDFYAACTAPGGHGFQGAILYGKAGTGKTMGCRATLARLDQEGRAIWQTDFRAGQKLLSLDEEQALLVTLQTKGSEAVRDELIAKFSPEWSKADILFIDDTNSKHDTLAEVSNAAMKYARAHSKKILITCNSDPIHAFRSTIEFPVD